MKTIIATTDFSPASYHATFYAAQLAVFLQAELILFHAVAEQVSLVPDLSLVGLGYEEDVSDDSLQTLEALRDKLLLATDNKLVCETKLRFGKVVEELKQLRYEVKPIVTVMAATKKNWLAQTISGCNTLCVSQKCHEAVLLIPETAQFTGLAKVAMATDLDDVFNTVPLQKITRFLHQFTASLSILHILKSDVIHSKTTPETVALQIHFREFNPKFQFVSNKDVEAGIEQFIATEKPDLLIIIPKKEAVWHKSLSKPFILHPSIPILAISK